MIKGKGMNLQLFGMKNLDILQQQKAAIFTKINQAIKDGKEEDFSAAFEEWTNMVQESCLAEAKGLVQAADNTILAGRGVRALTSEENKYYEKLIGAMKSGNPKQELTIIDDVLPKTVIDAVFEDIAEDHPLLDAINFQNTAALTEILISTQDGRHMATWGELCDAIITELAGSFSVIDLEQKKLSAFIPVCNAMLEIGPAWLDRYVRTILAEAIANGLEEAIIDGNGLSEPTGMRRNPGGALDPATGYPLLALTPVTQITPKTYGALFATLAVGPNGLTRNVGEVLLVVNPLDYYSILMPAISFRMADGSWVERLPLPTRIIQSVHVTRNEAILGIGKRYFFGLGTGKGGKIEYTDHRLFLEDKRLYRTKLYGNGKPLDALSFLRLNIANLVPTVDNININNWPAALNVDVVDDPLLVSGIADARLASLTVGTLDLVPAFNKSVMIYTAATGNATDVIKAVAKDGEATIAIKVGETAVENGAAATWAEGANTVKITVTRGVETETYTVTVTYTPAG